MAPSSPRFLTVLGLVALLSGACAGSSGEASSGRPGTWKEEMDAPAETVVAPITELSRAEVRATVDAGLGKFFQKVELEGVVESGEFRGFRILRFTEPAEWRGVGLLAGDVVQRINGQSIERPEQAFAVFASLKTAPSLDVTYSRGGKAMQLSLPIVGRVEEESVATSTEPKSSSEKKAEPPKN